MQARGSSYRNSEILTLLLALPVLLSGCGARSAWGMPVEELRARFSQGDFSPLASVDLGKRDPADALAIGPEAPYYLAYGFDAAKRPEGALAMLEIASTRSPEPWRSEAGIALANRLIDGRDYAGAEKAARAVVEARATPETVQRGRRALVESIYWQKRDTEVLEGLRDLPPDPELELFRAVSSWRLDAPGARALFVELFRTQPVSALHSRAYTFLASEESWLGRFSQPEQDFFAAKYSLSQGDWGDGVRGMEQMLSTETPDRIAGSSLVADLANACVSGGLVARGGAFLEALAPRLDGQARIDCLETAGRLYRRAGSRSQAVRLLSGVAQSATDPAQADRARWYMLDVLVDMGPADLVQRVVAQSQAWKSPAEFTDVLERLVSDLVAGRRWTDLVRLREGLAKAGPPETRAQLAWLLARLAQERKLPATSLTGLTPTDLLEEAVAASPDGYYGVLASLVLGRMPALVAGAAGAGAAATVAPRPTSDQMVRALGPLAAGFLRYGLTAEGYRRVQGQRDGLSVEVIEEAARDLAAAGDYRSSLNLMAYLDARGSLAVRGLELMFPRPWPEPMAAAASENRVSESLLAALVREESFFDPDIVSSAGAVGLAQLMPDAASDAARRLKLSDPDLEDPVTSLRLGSRHLRGLLDSTGSPARALLAYNAGLSRLRGWERTWADLPDDLLVEAVPYVESRGYVRKIVVSDLLYGWLYEGRDPRDALRELFPSSRM